MELIDLKQFPIKIKDYPHLVRRLPTPKNRTVKDHSGRIVDTNTIIGCAGVMRLESCFTTAWLCRCNCGIYYIITTGAIFSTTNCKKCRIKKLNWGWANLV